MIRHRSLFRWGMRCLAGGAAIVACLVLLARFVRHREPGAAPAAPGSAEKLRECELRIRQLSAELARVKETERRELAVRLHDGVGQSLALARIRLAKLMEPGCPQPVREAAVEVRQFVDEALQQTRSWASDLSDRVLHEAGLSAGLEWLGRQFASRHGLDVQVRATVPAGLIKPEDEALLLEAARELLMNVVKHARADGASVELLRDGQSLSLVIEDDGEGFCASDAGQRTANCGGFGLASIRERMARCGGGVHLQSEAGTGSRVTLEVPLRAPASMPRIVPPIPKKQQRSSGPSQSAASPARHRATSRSVAKSSSRMQ